jgi:hypothetical protein
MSPAPLGEPAGCPADPTGPDPAGRTADPSGCPAAAVLTTDPAVAPALLVALVTAVAGILTPRWNHVRSPIIDT